MGDGNGVRQAAMLGYGPSVEARIDEGNAGDVTSLAAETARATAAEATKAQALVPTVVKTADYASVAKDFVLVDATDGNRVVTLPAAPPDQSRVGAKMVAQNSTNTVAVTCAGSDKINLPTGGTTYTIRLLNQSAVLQYVASTSTWTVQAGDTPLGPLDVRFAKVATARRVPRARGQIGFLPNGVKLRGANITVKPSTPFTGGGVWVNLWDEWDWTGWVKFQVDSAYSLGCNAVRIIGGMPLLATGQSGVNDRITKWRQLIEYCATLDMYVLPCLSEVAQVAQPTTQLANVAARADQFSQIAAAMDGYSNVVAIDMTNEIQTWFTTQAMSQADIVTYVAAYTAAVRAQTSIPLTWSAIGSSTNGTNANFSDTTRMALFDPYLDFHDFHCYYDVLVTDLNPYFLNQGKPVLIGEIGLYSSALSSDRTNRYKAGRNLAEHPGVMGVFQWAIADQDTVTTNMWGLVTNSRTTTTSPVTLPVATLPVASTAGGTDNPAFAASGTVTVAGQTITYTSKDATNFLGCTGGQSGLIVPSGATVGMVRADAGDVYATWPRWLWPWRLRRVSTVNLVMDQTTGTYVALPNMAVTLYLPVACRVDMTLFTDNEIKTAATVTEIRFKVDGVAFDPTAYSHGVVGGTTGGNYTGRVNNVIRESVYLKAGSHSFDAEAARTVGSALTNVIFGAVSGNGGAVLTLDIYPS